MTMISEQWAELQLPVIYKWFEVGQTMRPSLVPQMYQVENSSRAYEEHIGIGGIDEAVWGIYEKAGQIPTVGYDKGYKKTFTHLEYPVDVKVKRKMLADDQYGIIRDTARRLGISINQQQEGEGASTFNNAFTAGAYVGSDNVALVSASHPYAESNTAVQTNTFALELTAANVETMRIAMMGFKDDAGNILNRMPDTVLVPVGLGDTARKVLGSPLDPASANNTINPQAGRWNVVEWNRLTDTNAWFMIDSVWMKESLIWYNHTLPEFTFKTLDQVTVVWGAYMRYSYGFADWRWIAGSNPS